jgi:protein-disulfide isomerase
VNRRTLLLVGGAAVLLAAALIGASLLGGDDDDEDAAPTTQATTTATETGPLPEIDTSALAAIEGVPQNGLVLGPATAPATIVEYADMQCPFCAEFAQESLPELVDEWVRPGEARIDFRGLDFLGSDSKKALRFVLGAAESDKAWSAIELLFGNQGEENSGWVTDGLLRAIATELALDPDAMVAATQSTRYDAAIERMSAQAEADGVSGTPSFLVGRTGATTTVQVGTGALEPDAFRPALEAATSG